MTAISFEHSWRYHQQIYHQQRYFLLLLLSLRVMPVFLSATPSITFVYIPGEEQPAYLDACMLRRWYHPSLFYLLRLILGTFQILSFTQVSVLKYAIILAPSSKRMIKKVVYNPWETPSLGHFIVSFWHFEVITFKLIFYILKSKLSDPFLV